MPRAHRRALGARSGILLCLLIPIVSPARAQVPDLLGMGGDGGNLPLLEQDSGAPPAQVAPPTEVAPAPRQVPPSGFRVPSLSGLWGQAQQAGQQLQQLQQWNGIRSAVEGAGGTATLSLWPNDQGYRDMSITLPRQPGQTVQLFQGLQQAGVFQDPQMAARIQEYMRQSDRVAPGEAARLNAWLGETNGRPSLQAASLGIGMAPSPLEAGRFQVGLSPTFASGMLPVVAPPTTTQGPDCVDGRPVWKTQTSGTPRFDWQGGSLMIPLNGTSRSRDGRPTTMTTGGTMYLTPGRVQPGAAQPFQVDLNLGAQASTQRTLFAGKALRTAWDSFHRNGANEARQDVTASLQQKLGATNVDFRARTVGGGRPGIQGSGSFASPLPAGTGVQIRPEGLFLQGPLGSGGGGLMFP